MNNDLINAVFELSGSLAVWANIYQIRKDKGYAGISVYSLVFFTLWGAWNLVYYPSLHQWLSFFAGCSIFLANIVWIILIFFYGKKNKPCNMRPLTNKKLMKLILTRCENNETKTKILDRDLQRTKV